MAYTTATLTGHYLKTDGTPAEGTVEIIPNSSHLVDAEGDVILAGRVKVTLDGTGSFTATLPATDDATIEPASGRQYTVVAKLRHTHLAAVTGVELQGGTTVDVADVASLPVVDPAVTLAATPAQLAALEDTLSAEIAGKQDAGDYATATDLATKADVTALDTKQDTATLDTATAGRINDPASATATALTATVAGSADLSGRAAQATSPDLLRVVSRGATPLAIPTYVATNDETTHPAVYFNPNGWNGYRYWLAHTPYTAADNQVENVSIVVSNDAATWIDAPGGSNPLDPSPGAPGYNSDPELVMGPDGTLHLFWRQATPTNEYIYHRASLDGVTWTPKVAVITSVTASRRPVSPTVVFDGRRWHMWAIDMIPATNTVLYWTHEGDPGQAWTDNPATCDLAAPAGRDPWHFGIVRTPGGEFHCVLQDSTLTESGTNSDVWFLTSTHPTTGWQRSAKPLLKRHGSPTGRWDQSLYRPTLVPFVKDGRDGYLIFYGSSVPGWFIGKAEAVFETANDAKAMELFKGQAKISPFTLADLANRADSATTPNPTSSGLTYTVTSGTLGVSGAGIYAPTSGNNKGMHDTGSAAHEISADYPVIGTPTYLIARYVDESNFVRAGLSGGNWTLQKVVAGAVTTVAVTTGGGRGANGDRLRLRASGNTLSFYVNDVLELEGTVTEGNTATKVAIYAQDTATRIRNVLARTV